MLFLGLVGDLCTKYNSCFFVLLILSHIYLIIFVLTLYSNEYTCVYINVYCFYFQSHNTPDNPLFITPERPSFKNCIQLGACQIDQTLPMHPDLPADLFTSCLTTPIKMAARW